MQLSRGATSLCVHPGHGDGCGRPTGLRPVHRWWQSCSLWTGPPLEHTSLRLSSSGPTTKRRERELMNDTEVKTHTRVDKVFRDSNWSRRALHLVVAERKLVLTKIILTAASPSSACDSWTIGFFGTTRMWVGAWGEISGKATHWNNKWTKRRRKGFYF